MTPKQRPDTTPPSNPTSFPQTPPPSSGADVSMWLMTAVNRLEASTARIEARLDGIQADVKKTAESIGTVETEVRSQGRWIHTLKVLGTGLFVLLCWVFVNAVWPWLKTRIGLPA